MDTEKHHLAGLLMIHLNRKPVIAIDCENFSSFYSDGEGAHQRCLPDEYLRKDGKPYFNLEEVKTICPRFRQEWSDKCCIHGIIPAEEIWTEQEMQELLRKTRRKYGTE